MMGGFGVRRRVLVLFLGVGAMAIAVGSAIGGAKLAGATSAEGRSITAVQTASESVPFSTNSTAFVDVPGATATVAVPKGTTALVVIRFTASSFCNIQLGGSCLVRARINGADASPGEVVWARTPTYGDVDGPSAHAMDWSAGPLPPGTYAMQVQAGVQYASGFLSFSNWHLTVERVKT
jgi:hypothetical protein